MLLTSKICQRNLCHLTIGHMTTLSKSLVDFLLKTVKLCHNCYSDWQNVSAMKCTATYLFQPHLQKVHTSEFSAWNTNCIIIIYKKGHSFPMPKLHSELKNHHFSFWGNKTVVKSRNTNNKIIILYWHNVQVR